MQFGSRLRRSLVPIGHMRLSPFHALMIGTGLSLVLGLSGFFMLIRPLQHHINSLEKEKAHWREILTFPRERGHLFDIPTMEKLPNSIEECRSYFLEKGVEVKAFNVERFASANGKEITNDYGGANGSAVNAKFDYALVRMHWQGPWESIEKGLAKMEEAPDLGISVQEVLLDKDGGQGVFRIYFRN